MVCDGSHLRAAADYPSIYLTIYPSICICVYAFVFCVFVIICCWIHFVCRPVLCVSTIHIHLHTEWQTVGPRAGSFISSAMQHAALLRGQTELFTESIRRPCVLIPHVNVCSPAWLAGTASLPTDTSVSFVMDQLLATWCKPSSLSH